MKKLDEIREELAQKEAYGWDDVVDRYAVAGFECGWDAAIALNLPVKFGMFIMQQTRHHGGDAALYNGKMYTMDKMFDYWIENVYKPK